MQSGAVTELALRHQRARIRLAQATAIRSLGMFRTVDLNALDASWGVVAAPLTAAVVTAQTAAAQQSGSFMDQVAAAQQETVPSAVVNPAAFAGVTGDGRELGPALFGGITTTKSLIGSGLEPARAFEAGAAFLATVVQSAIADAGRQSDRVTATGRNYTMYVRVVQAGACSRCAILAGKGEYRKAFLRHPNCHCTSVPQPADNPDAPVPRGLHASPDDYFKSLTPAEQDRIFTNSGAQAIRDGADPIAVVNARRGAGAGRGGLTEKRFGMSAPLGYDSAGKPIKVFTTSEGTTIRGSYGRAEYARQQEFTKGVGDRYRVTKNYRLMPESIYSIAGADQAKAIALLKQYGYLR